MNLADVLMLKYPNADFMTDIRLCDHGLGAGIEIQYWGLDDPEPTTEDIAAWKIEYDLAYRQRAVMDIRKAAYPSWEKQLQMQYADAINGTTTWKDALAEVKAANPIPME